MTFGRKLILSFFIPIIALAVVAFAGHSTMTTLLDDQGWVTHTYEVRGQIERLQRLMVDAESARAADGCDREEFLEPLGEWWPPRYVGSIVAASR